MVRRRDFFYSGGVNLHGVSHILNIYKGNDCSYKRRRQEKRAETYNNRIIKSIASANGNPIHWYTLISKWIAL